MNSINSALNSSAQTHENNKMPSQAINFTSSNGNSLAPDSLVYNIRPRQSYAIFQNDRTVKMFKHLIYGPQTQVVGHSIGDSGAEVTLVREDLIKQLGIEGTPTVITIQWTDGTSKAIKATKVTLELKGLSRESKLLKLENCYAVDNLNLPPRSLDVNRLKRQFPHLENVDFDGYENAIPILLLGSPHAACFEAIEPIKEDGIGKPIAIKTKLGWSIFGGELENYPVLSNDSQKSLLQTKNQPRSLVLKTSIEAVNVDHQVKPFPFVPRQHPLVRMHDIAMRFWSYLFSLLIRVAVLFMVHKPQINNSSQPTKPFISQNALRNRQMDDDNQHALRHREKFQQNTKNSALQYVNFATISSYVTRIETTESSSRSSSKKRKCKFVKKKNVIGPSFIDNKESRLRSKSSSPD